LRRNKGYFVALESIWRWSPDADAGACVERDWTTEGGGLLLGDEDKRLSMLFPKLFIRMTRDRFWE